MKGLFFAAAAVLTSTTLSAASYEPPVLEKRVARVVTVDTRRISAKGAKPVSFLDRLWISELNVECEVHHPQDDVGWTAYCGQYVVTGSLLDVLPGGNIVIKLPLKLPKRRTF